jgi:hypothetical protein
MNSKGLNKSILKACLTYSGLHQERTCCKIFYKHGKQGRMEEFKGDTWARNFH